MSGICDILTTQTHRAFAEAGFDLPPEQCNVTPSDRPDLCDFQCNASFAAAKLYKRKPLDIASEVAERLENCTVAAPGFLNINVSNDLLTERLNAMAQDRRLGFPSVEAKTIVLDYGGPNVAKALHVGHLRSAVIGDALYKIAGFLGYRVISDIHLGDWGFPMGLVLAALQERGFKAGDELAPQTLNTIYPEAAARAKTDEVFQAEAKRITVELQQGNAEYFKIWKQIQSLSVADAKANYDALNVRDFDYWYGESDAQRYVPRTLEIFERRGLIRDDNGTKLVDIKLDSDKEPMPPVIVVKADGGEVYATTDLATILQRVEDWKPDACVYLTDNRQTLHFKQVFRAAKLAGIAPPDIDFTHIGFGTVNGADGKPYKTRDGGVMSLSTLIADVRAVLPDERVACAAIRIGELQNQPLKDYRFDVEKFCASEGKTGPYLQYTAVRIASVLAKADAPDAPNATINAPASDVERGLMLALERAGISLLKAWADKAPSAICDCLFDICARFNSFYAAQHILTCEDATQKASWLALLQLTREVIVTLLGVLGVDVPENM
ncbi:MAG: arginine--tRNA ligase [Oscillospiraceae bacterium]|nr:arginine--tRNA ligase [Oscillospiraceae bacterium]